MGEELTAGFTYEIQHWRGSEMLESEVVRNLMPTEGKNHVLNAVLKSGTVYATWYVGLFEGDITPEIANVMSTFPVAATECSSFASPTVRKTLTLGTVASGAVSNSASPAEFTMTATKTIYGCFVAPSSTVGNTASPPLLSAVRFSTAKDVVSGDIIRVIGGFSLTDA